MEEKQQKKNPNKFWQKLKKGLVKTGSFSLDLLFPQDMKCIFCGNDIPDFEDKPYCEECEKKGVLNDGHRCRICDVRVHDSRDICEYCDKSNKQYISPKFDKAFCPFLYNKTTKGAILRFKDDNGRFLTKTFTKYICNAIKEANISIDIIVPVPSHPKTVRRRGYNQAQLLADEIGKEFNVEVNTTCVLKDKYTKQQKTLNFADRRRNIRESLSFHNLEIFKDKNVLIVDDVLTTCSTMNAIAEKLRPKANNIYVATIARRELERKRVKNLKDLFKKLLKKTKNKKS